MIPVQIRFTKKLIEHIDKLIESGVYSNRSEAIRDGTRRLVMEMTLKDGANFPTGSESTEVPEVLKREMNVR